jgi:hypothetical protein
VGGGGEKRGGLITGGVSASLTLIYIDAPPFRCAGTAGQTGICGQIRMDSAAIQGEAGVAGQTGICGQIRMDSAGMPGEAGVAGQTGICGQIRMDSAGMRGGAGASNPTPNPVWEEGAKKEAGSSEVQATLTLIYIDAPPFRCAGVAGQTGICGQIRMDNSVMRGGAGARNPTPNPPPCRGRFFLCVWRAATVTHPCKLCTFASVSRNFSCGKPNIQPMVAESEG